MGFSGKLSCIGLMVISIGAVAVAADFAWDWRSQEVIGRNDPSVGNTSKLTEPDRAALIDAPMSEHGYDDQRIREIASTTRVRFVDLGGEGKAPLLIAESIGLEGGCDSKANCPMWVFRHTDDGYIAILDTVAASYTVQPTSANGFSDLVLMRQISASESQLTLYSYADGKYANAACYTANWPPAKDGEPQAPDVSACKTDEPAK
jgi:hypothetical protein